VPESIDRIRRGEGCTAGVGWRTATARVIRCEWFAASAGRRETTMPLTAVEIIEGQDADELEIEVKLKGKPDAVINALCNGLPREVLTQLQDALSAELAKRQTGAK
jgi:hypothetical protein